MAEENLKDFTINWIITGLLLFSLVSFALLFMYHNNPDGLGQDTKNVFERTQGNLSTKLYSARDDSNRLLNITSNTNPEASDLGSRDSVASSYEMKGSGTGFFESMKLFFSWVFVGDSGKLLLSVFGGIIGFLAVYYIVKAVRNGF